MGEIVGVAILSYADPEYQTWPLREVMKLCTHVTPVFFHPDRCVGTTMRVMGVQATSVRGMGFVPDVSCAGLVFVVALACGGDPGPAVEGSSGASSSPTGGADASETSDDGTEASTQGSEASTQGSEASTQGSEASTQGSEASTQGSEASTRASEDSDGPSSGEPTDDTGDPPGACERTVGACEAPQVVVTEVDLGVAITGYGSEWDTLPLPLAIAPMPSGGSRLAALGTDGNIHVAELDCDDQLVGTPFTIPAVDLQDLHADDEGGVVMLTRDAVGSGDHHCGEGPLCGGESAPCYNSFLVRFDAAGNEQWAAMVTNADDGLDPYTNEARFVWQHYQHHGRIAFDGENYAAYFCIGITVQNGACVDIHEGDRMQVIDGDGAPIVDHPDAFGVGCSHSWTTRIVWDPRTSRFVMVCATDNDCRIAQPNPYRTIAAGTCDGTLFGGDVVLASTTGYWTAWSQGEQIRLEHFTDGPSDTTIMNAGPSAHPHLVSYGEGHMLLAWESGSGIAAQVRDAGTGEPVGSELAIDVPDHAYQGWKAFADGSVAYAGAGTTETSVRIARVLPCAG